MIIPLTALQVKREDPWYNLRTKVDHTMTVEQEIKTSALPQEAQPNAEFQRYRDEIFTYIQQVTENEVNTFYQEAESMNQ